MTKDIDAMIGEVNLYDQQIFDLQQTIADKVHALTQARNEAKEKLDLEITKLAMKELKGKDYGCGTANIETPLYKIKTVVSKSVKWDEDILRRIAGQIKEAGQDPEVYIKYKLSVSETAFKSFPEPIQQAFIPARTVEPSSPKITIERK